MRQAMVQSPGQHSIDSGFISALIGVSERAFFDELGADIVI